MAEQKQSITDPFTAWRTWLDQTERQINNFFNKFMSSEQYNRAMAQFNDFSLNMQKSLNDAASRYFSSLNLPTRDDFGAMEERLAALENRLDAFERSHREASDGSRLEPSEGSRRDASRISEPSRPASGVPRPPRTKKPASGNHKS